MIVRIAAAAAVSALCSFIAARILIPWLRKLKAGQSIKEIGPKWHMSKQGTPTMGGLIFIFGVFAACVTAGVTYIAEGNLTHIYLFAFSLVFGLIGFLDDFVKVKKKRNTGLSAIQKFLVQVAAAVAFIALLRLTGHLTPSLYIPFFDVTWQINETVYYIFSAFVIVGTVNAVNITDGIDGLVTGVTIPVVLFFMACAIVFSIGSVALFCGALAAGLLVFLIFNFHPAKIFMGDTGSLFLGGAVCAAAFALNMPLVLVPVGIIYIIETLSDIIQVAYFKLTHGKRVFKMAPLHHHFEMCGWSEVKIFTVFTSISFAMCIITFFAVSGKYPF